MVSFLGFGISTPEGCGTVVTTSAPKPAKAAAKAQLPRGKSKAAPVQPDIMPIILGVEPVDLSVNLEQDPYDFTFAGWSNLRTVMTRTGSRELPGGTTMQVEITSVLGDFQKMMKIDALVLGPNIEAAGPYLSYLASLSYDGSSPARSRDWVKSHWMKVKTGRPISMMAGPVEYELYGTAKFSVGLKMKHRNFVRWQSVALAKLSAP